MDDMVNKHPRDIFWQYVGGNLLNLFLAYLEQLRYMYRGYLTRINV